MKTVAVIMAGGKGERFWPKSRKDMPKQFLSLTQDGKTMIQHTVERVRPLVHQEDIYIVTNKSYKELIKKQLPTIQEENILLEPVGKNTAPCIGLATIHIRKKYKEAMILILPADHLVKDPEVFIEVVKKGVENASETQNIVTIGIVPNYPETGYGYIQYEKSKENQSFKVKRFVEKPQKEVARLYLQEGNYLWNSGIFLWKTSTICKLFGDYLPEMWKGLEQIETHIGTASYERVLEEQFSSFTPKSVDYGILEKAENIYVIQGEFGWDDVGNWVALERVNEQDSFHNVVEGNIINIDTEGSIIQAANKLIATIGIKDLIVVDTEDVLLICDKGKSQDIKQIIEKLREQNKTQYL